MIHPHEAAEVMLARLGQIDGLSISPTAAGQMIDKSTNRLGEKSAYISAGGVSATGRRFRWDIRLSDHSAAGDIAHISIVLPTDDKIDEAVAYIEGKLAL